MKLTCYNVVEKEAKGGDIMRIGEIIKQRRNELGLTLEEVGKAVGVGKSTVKKWESGYITNMRRDRIANLARVLQLSPTVFIDAEDVEDSPAPRGRGVKIPVLGDKYIDNTINLTSHEKRVVTAYREQPEMQPAVDRLLGVSDVENNITKTDYSSVPIAAQTGSEGLSAAKQKELTSFVDAINDLERKNK